MSAPPLIGCIGHDCERCRTVEKVLKDNLAAWDGEEDSVKAEHAELIERTRKLCERVRA